jgi:hypothetical protein
MAVSASRSRLATALEQMMEAGSDEELAAIVTDLDESDRVALLEMFASHLGEDAAKQLNVLVAEITQSYRPQTRAELWKMMRDECGIRVPRKAVCEGHCAPMDMAEDVYFERGNPDKFAIGNRGSGKTNIMGALHYVNGKTKPKHEGATAGSVKSQAEKCYAYLRSVTDDHPDTIKTSSMGKTVFANGAEVGIITGTLTGVNSPHPQLAHLDEVELFRPGVLEEAEHMSQSKHGYRALDVKTTSWKKVRGPVSEAVEAVRAALREGVEPPVEIYHWCVWETTEPCPHDCAACPFSSVRKGTWPDGSPRTFEAACKRGSPGIKDGTGQGKLKYSDGFVALEDSVRRFRKMSRRNWDAQQESRRPQAEGLVYDNFDEDIHTVDFWIPDPAYGAVDLGLDFGGTDPHACVFWQHLNVDVTVELTSGRRITVPAGADVQFDEVYKSDVGNITFGKLINERIEAWETVLPGFRRNITGFYRDPAAKAAALDLASLSLHGSSGDPAYTNIPTKFIGHVQIQPGIALIYERIDDGLVYVDAMRCPNTIDEFGSYEKSPQSGTPIDDDNHTMDANRYRFWNRHRRSIRDKQRDGDPASPVGVLEHDHAVERQHDGTFEFRPGRIGGAGTIIAARPGRRSSSIMP